MGKLIHDNTHWPLALTIAQEKLTFEQHMASLEAWNSWFDKNEPFHVIRFYTDKASLEQDSGVGKATLEWMSKGADIKFRTLVKSMMIIVPPDQYPRMKNMDVTAVFGIPGGIFPTLDEAYNWLEGSVKSTDLSDLKPDWKQMIKQTLKLS
ncbi:hypothetical protein EBI01_15740 [Marinomonas rhizomae]|uniref:DNA phosphorothioation-dependent restriction protein DptG n=1 Tax=Marinomonas rhizomae TaxID=491948 RepID=A0A366IXA3_9GAMM|nr:hypothetical protein [Marinomonas rhizomae]RBP79413.1 DNA phosphorothioation-dependent restriction protein DptG [Marinomonas rhizomae]RNF71342.1 hypothetical protein EBI01_15740 [Marinomonas rhizomae]